MNISARHRDGVTILDLKGKFTIGAGDVALRDAVQEALGASAKKILVNMGDVTLLDSSGIGELVAAYTSVSNRGGQLKLENLPARISDLLQITQLISVFEVFDNEDEALKSF